MSSRRTTCVRDVRMAPKDQFERGGIVKGTGRGSVTEIVGVGEGILPEKGEEFGSE